MQKSKRLLSRVRILGILVSAAGLLYILHRIQTKAFAASFQTLDWGWLLLGLLSFGLLFIPAAYRWRLALQAGGTAISFGAALRISLIGHFFYTVLLGAAGGDTAKSMLYSRWHQIPVTQTLAASSLDRLLGLAGLILFMTFAFGFALSEGSFEKLGPVTLRWPLWWVLAAACGLTVAGLWLKRSSTDSVQMHFLRNLRDSARALLRSRVNLLSGIGCGVAVQAALSSVLAFCLAATSPEALPWSKLAWTFPLIAIISALPVTFAGIGVRDGAAVVLFGLYQIPPATAVAASLLTAGVNLVWAAACAGLLWRQAVRHEPHTQLKSLWAAVPR